jgi:hypothetical protein
MPRELSDTDLQEIQKNFTSYHFNPYLSAANNFKDALHIYEINIQLCEAMYPCLHTIEITLRNSIHSVLTNKYGQDWFSSEALRLTEHEREEINQAIKKLQRLGYVEISNRIVSEMTFGFWKSLIQKKIYEDTIWKPCCKGIFLAAKPRELNLKVIRGKIQRILNLRNKVFHHDCIWNDDEICDIYEDIYQFIFWMNPKIFNWAKDFDRFTEVYSTSSKLLDGLCKK